MAAVSRTVTAAIAASLLIAACGSDDGDSDATVAESMPESTAQVTEETTAETTAETMPETTEGETADTVADETETTETTVADEQDVEADTAAAEAALLTVADFPEGTTEAAANDSTAEVRARLAECAGLESVTPSAAQAVSGAFVSADGSQTVEQVVGVLATERDARMVNASVSPPQVDECLVEAYAELGAAALTPGAVADGAEIGVVTASRLAVASVGDATQAIRVVVPVTVAGATTEVTVDHTLVRSGRSVALTTYESTGAPFTVEAIDAINSVVASRLPA